MKGGERKNLCGSGCDGALVRADLGNGVVSIRNFDAISTVVFVDRWPDKIAGKAHGVDEIFGGFVIDRDDGSFLREGLDEGKESGGGPSIVVGLVDGHGPVGELASGGRELRIGVEGPRFKGDLSRGFVDADDAISRSPVVKIGGVDVARLIVVFEGVGRADDPKVTGEVRAKIGLAGGQRALAIEEEVSLVWADRVGASSGVVDRIPNTGEEI